MRVNSNIAVLNGLNLSENSISEFSHEGAFLSKIKDFFTYRFRAQVHKKILISFCKLSNPQNSGLLLYDVCCFTGHWIDLGFPKEITGCRGLSRHREFILIAFQAEGRAFISVISERNLKPLFYIALEEVREVHSICALDNSILVVSTGTDEVIGYEFSNKGFRNPMVIWKASNEKRDTHHVNSILQMENEIYISAFGPKNNELWLSATNGYIYNISTDKFIKEGINHPHSLSAINGRIYYCESAQQQFRSLGGEINFKLDGYTRGICFLDRDTVIIGTSVGRKSSKSTGIIYNPADPGDPSGECSLTLYHLQNGIISKLDMSTYGSEVYDLCLLS